MYGQPSPAVTNTVMGKASGEFSADFHFSFDSATEALVQFLHSKDLLIEVWGVQGKFRVCVCFWALSTVTDCYLKLSVLQTK